MITRIWHGMTKVEHADEYLKYIEKTGIPAYRKVNGNLSAKILRRVEGDICHFMTVTEWDSFNRLKSLPVIIMRRPVIMSVINSFL